MEPRAWLQNCWHIAGLVHQFGMPGTLSVLSRNSNSLSKHVKARLASSFLLRLADCARIGPPH